MKILFLILTSILIQGFEFVLSGNMSHFYGAKDLGPMGRNIFYPPNKSLDKDRVPTLSKNSADKDPIFGNFFPDYYTTKEGNDKTDSSFNDDIVYANYQEDNINEIDNNNEQNKNSAEIKILSENRMAEGIGRASPTMDSIIKALENVQHMLTMINDVLEILIYNLKMW